MKRIDDLAKVIRNPESLNVDGHQCLSAVESTVTYTTPSESVRTIYRHCRVCLPFYRIRATKCLRLTACGLPCRCRMVATNASLRSAFTVHSLLQGFLRSACITLSPNNYKSNSWLVRRRGCEQGLARRIIWRS